MRPYSSRLPTMVAPRTVAGSSGLAARTAGPAVAPSNVRPTRLVPVTGYGPEPAGTTSTADSVGVPAWWRSTTSSVPSLVTA